MPYLNLGCGKQPLEDWINLDREALPGVDVVFDLEECATKPLPFEADSIDAIKGVDLLEHIVNVLPMMQELHRIARPGALCTFVVPHGGNDEAWENPTHVRPYFPGSFGFFSQPFYWREDYGYRGDWKTVRVVLVVEKRRYHSKMTAQAIAESADRYRNAVKKMQVELEAVKPIREARQELQEPYRIEVALT